MGENNPRELLEAGRFEDLANEEHPLWRGLAMLELRRPREAARVFEEAPEAQESGTMLELAVERWISALDAGYDSPSGAIKPPALLVYAGTRLGDDRYVKRGLRLLGKLWKPKISKTWPGPVGGFLIDQVEQARFLEDGYDDPHLEERRLTSAYFWAALKDPAQARELYEKAVAPEGASVLEVEHHLAHGELA